MVTGRSRLALEDGWPGCHAYSRSCIFSTIKVAATPKKKATRPIPIRYSMVMLLGS
jgi:hypothetical protein